jgi:tRNA pseudouridine38-40 synthase
LKLTIAYDGTAYCGWQTQPNGPSIQSTLTEAITRFTGARPTLYAAGRTDAGVHAVGQVVSFSTASPVPATNFRPALQTCLPDDIVIRSAEDVPRGFHAQFHARVKTYRYLIHNAPTWSPFHRHHALWHRAPLDDQAMDHAIRQIVGTFDFRSLETQWPNRKTSIRTVIAASVTRTSQWSLLGCTGGHSPPVMPDPAGEFLCMEITANGFLYNMVRTIAGTLIHVGRGKWSRSALKEIVDLQDRRRAGETAPAHGLYLWNVDYGDAGAGARFISGEVLPSPEVHLEEDFD